MRLLSLAPSNTEILYALDVGEQVVGVTGFCNYPKDAKSKPKLGGWTTPIVERIRQLSPDLPAGRQVFIFTSYFLPPELRGWKGPGEIIHVAPKTLDEVYQSINYLGKKAQRSKIARQIVEEMKAHFQKIKSFAPLNLASSAPRVYMEEWPVPPMSSGNWVPELVEIAGGVSFAHKGKPSDKFAFEDLMRFDPDVMIFHWCGYGERFNEKLVRERPFWEKLRAIKENKLFVIDDSLLNRPGPRLVEGARMIQKIIRSNEK